jgi:chloramphenicol-sensitive protein RarD
MTQSRQPAAESRIGLLFGVGAYGFWGIVPLYFRQVQEVPPLELLSHRIIWSVVLLMGLLLVLGRGPLLKRCLTTRSTRRTLALTTVLIGLNWYTYIYAVTHQQVVQASLGYFIAPLVSAGLGVIVLHERLRNLQRIALVFAAIGVAVLGIATGEFPWIALTLAISFSIYGLLRKTVAADSLTGLTVEAIFLVPLAIAYAGWLLAQGNARFGAIDRTTDLWMIAGSVVTVIPLYCFGQAARKLRLTTLGFLQYLSPTGQFLMAVTLFGEPFGQHRLVGFIFIWIGLIAYTIDILLTFRVRLAMPPAPVPIPE